MNILRKFARGIRALFQKRKLDAEMDDEMRSHIEMRMQLHIDSGRNPEEARFAALRQFGWMELIKEKCREERGVGWLENLGKDIHFAARQLRKNPGFTLVAVLTLAIGIGANTAMFSFVNAILLRPLPYQESDRLVMVFENHPESGSHMDSIGASVLGEWRQRSITFESLAARGSGSFNLSGENAPENVPGASVSANMFSMLRVRPILGRDFVPEEETYGHHRVLLLSHELWMRRFGGNTNILGQSLQVNTEPYTVIGVMPPRLFFPDRDTQLWTPLAFTPDQIQQRHNHRYQVFGRLKPGVTLEQSRRDMDATARNMAADNPDNKGWGAEVYPLREIVVGDTHEILFLLLGAVGLVLLIVCANVANLLLAKSAARGHEFAIRTALGASRGQILRQLFTESLLLAVLGALGGILLARVGLSALIHFSPPNLPRIWEGISLDFITLGFTVLLTLATGIIFGLVPALKMSKATVASGMNDKVRGSSAGREGRTRALLVIGEVALTITLLAGTGLMLRSFSRLVSQPLGYVPEHLVTANIILPSKKYALGRDHVQFYQQLLERVRSKPGVDSAACAYGLPLGAMQSTLSVHVQGTPPPGKGEIVAANYSQVTPGYFSTMKIPLIQGADFTELDRENTPARVIVDETFVRNFKLGPNPLEKRIDVGDGTENAEIIAVAKDTKQSNIAEAAPGKVYRSYRQKSWGPMTLIVRTRLDPSDIARMIRVELAELDKDLPLQNVQTMTQLVASSVAQKRLSVQLLAGFSAVAVFLAALGLYGVLSYDVAQRTREIGIRSALGARRMEILGLIIRQGMTLVGVGIALGLGGAFFFTRLLRSQLYEIQPWDPFTFTAVPLLLAVVAVLACLIPAYRAANVHPVIALRQE
jgi:putative ABC transport system permease protein